MNGTLVKDWYTVPLTGDGTGADPFRPDLSGIADVVGYVVAAADAVEALVLVARLAAEGET